MDSPARVISADWRDIASSFALSGAAAAALGVSGPLGGAPFTAFSGACLFVAAWLGTPRLIMAVLKARGNIEFSDELEAGRLIVAEAARDVGEHALLYGVLGVSLAAAAAGGSGRPFGAAAAVACSAGLYWLMRTPGK